MSASSERRRWQLTDLQRFAMVVTVVVALFLGAMALGGANLPLFLVSVVLLVAAGLTVFLLGLRHDTIAREITTAYVVAVSAVPVGAIVGRCDMKLRVSLRGRPPVDVRHHDVALAVERWPRVGQTLPVDIESNAKRVRVRWDLNDQGYVRAPDPTPPRSYQPAGSGAAQRDATPSVRLYTEYADSRLNQNVEDPAFDVEYATLRALHPAADPFAETRAHTGHDADGASRPDVGRAVRADAAPFETTHPDFDPAEIDRSDFDPDPTEFEQTSAGTIPTPRSAQQQTLLITGPGTAVPARYDSTTDGGQREEAASIGGMLIVSDLDRSLRFYSEKLGFTIVYAASGNAVVEYGGARILLQHMADFSGIDRKVGHLHIQVPDLEAAYNELMAKGVAFRYRPKMVSRSDDVELWKAAFDDPDGHGVALTEWRHRR